MMPQAIPSDIAKARPMLSTSVENVMGIPRTRIGGAAVSAFVPQKAIAAPNVAPISESSTLSVSSRRTTRHRPAPSASRTLISR